MATKRKRTIGTTLLAIERAEAEIGRVFPPSFRDWLLRNNGLSIGAANIFPVFDERDPKTTWDSIVRQYDGGRWFPDYFEEEGLCAPDLLPFAALDSGDCYCFDYARQNTDGEVAIVWWSHETAQTQDRAASFAEFAKMAEDDTLFD